MIIPIEHLSEDAIENLAKEYCLRDWGLNEVESPLESRITTVCQAIQQGKLVVLYSEHHETAQLISADEIKLTE